MLCAAVFFAASTELRAGRFPGADEAVRAVFPGAVAERESILLSDAESAQVAERAGQDEPRALVTRYVVRRDNAVVGYAYLDKHLVRTLPEIILVSVDADGALQKIDVLAFQEPLEYLAPKSWLQQFTGRTVDDEIRLKKNVDGITGATLTARAVSQAARRILTVHAVLGARAP